MPTPSAPFVAASPAASAHRRSLAARRAFAFLCLLLLLGGGGLATAQTETGLSRATPVPLGQPVSAGPLELTVLQVVTGQEATDLVAGAGNDPPRDGVTYVAVHLRAVNQSEQAVALAQNDFAVTGASGLVRRFVGALAPAPSLEGVIPPGETREGWVVVAAAADERDLLLVFDSVTLHGRWADRVFALTDGAAVADAEAPLAARDDVATDPGSAIGTGETFTTDQWKIELVELAACSEVYDQSDFRVTALPPDDPFPPTPWIGLKVRVTNVAAGGEPAYLSGTAFMLVDDEGNAVGDVITLTAPYPEATGYYYPGASREGWVAFEIPEDYAVSGLALVRFLPWRTDEDPRYLTYAERLPLC